MRKTLHIAKDIAIFSSGLYLGLTNGDFIREIKDLVFYERQPQTNYVICEPQYKNAKQVLKYVYQKKE